MREHTSTSADHGQWPEIARLADQCAETAQGRVPVHELHTIDHVAAVPGHAVTVTFTQAECRALDELIQVGASVMLRTRGTYNARDLQSAQRTLQLAALRS